MSCFSSTKIPKKEEDLSKTKFDELCLQIGHSKLKFYADEGIFRQIENNETVYKKNNEMNQLVNEEADLKGEIDQKRKHLEKLKLKLEDIDKNLESMTNILNIDINERQFIYNVKPIVENVQKKSNNFV
jgi:hypothetical protein